MTEGEADAERELHFGRVLEDSSSERRTALIVFPVVLAIAAVIALAAVAISRMSGLSTQVQIAQQQVQEANKAVEQRDAQLRDAHAETAVLAAPGQGAAVLAATSPDGGASGLALDHPEQHALAVYAFNLNPPPEGQEYRVIVTNGSGQEQLSGVVTPNDRGAGFLLARNLPEGIDKIELALMPKQATPTTPPGDAAKKDGSKDEGKAPPPETRQPVLTGRLPRPGEAGVVAAAPPQQGRVQGRAARRGK